MGDYQPPHPPLTTATAQALIRIDSLANEYDTKRAATVRALFSEALASEPVVAATRRRLRLAGAL